MKLVYKITLTLILPLVLTLGLWGWFSYRTMSRKIHADTDLILRDYSNDIIMRLLSGKELPERFNGAYNTYYIEYVTAEYAEENPPVVYGEAEAFLQSQEDFASSRIRSQIFRDADGNYRKLTVSLPTFEQDVLIEHVLWWTVILFVVLLVAVMVIGLILLNYNMRPLYKLLEWIDNYEPGSPASEVPSDTDIIEFRKLSSAVEDAVARFEKQYEERKMFIGNASHELQTPLAVCSNRIEMLLDRPDLQPEVADELVKLHRSLAGLIKLNKTLLLLSKIENGQFPQTMRVDMNALIKGSVRMNSEVHEHKGISVDLTEEGALWLMMDDQMASILTGNLIRNAFRYTPDGGKIEIRISSDGFSISNTGASSLDKDKVFHKFYQPAGKKEGSTGLGLTLVRCVCVNNGLQASYDYADGKHIFAVILKKSK